MRHNYLVSYRYKKNGVNGLGFIYNSRSKKLRTFFDVKELATDLERENNYDSVVILYIVKLPL